MAKTRHILFLVTTIVACIDRTNGGHYSVQSNVENSQHQNDEPINNNISNETPSSSNQQSSSLANQSLDEKLNNDNDVRTRYELDQTVPQKINEEQYSNVINQLESEALKPESYYSNQEQVLPNGIQSANTPPTVIQQTNPGNVNLLPNQQSSEQSVNSNQIILQSELIRTTHSRSFYPVQHPNYANIATIPALTSANPHPLPVPQPQVSGHQIQVNNVQALPLSALPTVVSGQYPVPANVHNVLPQASVGVIPTQSINVHPLPLSLVQPLVVGNQIPINYNLHQVLPPPNVGVIPAQPIPSLQIPLSSSQILSSDRPSPNSGVHILGQENVGSLPAQSNLSPLPVTQQVLVNEHPPINFNVQSRPLLTNAPAAAQYIINGAGGTNIGQNSLVVNTQQAPIAPIVTKAIYFHAAPPDFQDAPVINALPPKKTYKIIFIKLPSQERRNSALLQRLYSQYAAREDKTLIYVLVKKPEEQQVIVQQPKAPSEHEVIFVKYRNVKENSATVGTNEAESKHDDGSLLKPGLINGH